MDDDLWRLPIENLADRLGIGRRVAWYWRRAYFPRMGKPMVDLTEAIGMGIMAEFHQATEQGYGRKQRDRIARFVRGPDSEQLRDRDCFWFNEHGMGCTSIENIPHLAAGGWFTVVPLGDIRDRIRAGVMVG